MLTQVLRAHPGTPCPPRYPVLTQVLLAHPGTPCSPRYSLLTHVLRAHPGTPCSPRYSLLTQVLRAHPGTPCSPRYSVLTLALRFHLGNPCAHPGAPCSHKYSVLSLPDCAHLRRAWSRAHRCYAQGEAGAGPSQHPQPRQAVHHAGVQFPAHPSDCSLGRQRCGPYSPARYSHPASQVLSPCQPGTRTLPGRYSHPASHPASSQVHTRYA